jgi:hypothetical protein
VIDYNEIRELAKELKRPSSTLIALSFQNDPFYVAKVRLRSAEWFKELWDRHGFGPGTHVRRIHYVLVSTPGAKDRRGDPYENTDDNYQLLTEACRDARYLELIPASHIVDRRLDEPAIHLFEPSTGAFCDVEHSEPDFTMVEMPELPELSLYNAGISQRYHVEIWCEKSTVNDILLPLAQRYHCNVLSGAGEISLTHCQSLIDRAVASGRPVRMLYVSDFDPGGMSMPVAVARKVEFLIRRDHPDLDVQVRPIVLTHDQCVEYALPRTPLKDSERRAAIFEARFGEGATELDALEALHPGEFARIIEEEIRRYYDDTLEERRKETVDEICEELTAIEEKVKDGHREGIDDLESDWADILRRIEDWRERAEPLWLAISEELDARKPDPDDYDWPEPEEGDEDPDPMFDSTREYVEQIDRYKEHQDKPTTGKPKKVA